MLGRTPGNVVAVRPLREGVISDYGEGNQKKLRIKYKYKKRNLKMNFIAKFFDELSARELYEIVRARQEIFLMEQNIICRDFDGVDYDALHCFLMEDGRVVAYMRAFMHDGEVHLGRFLTVRHGEGLGRALMESALPVVKEKLGCDKITFHAQKHAEGFYQKLGFTTVSDPFLEEGIEHVIMSSECRVQSAEL